jgi:hypothetical protein
MADSGHDDQPSPADRLGGAAGGSRAQQRVVGAVQDESWHAQPGQPAAVPFRAGLAALRGGITHAAALIPRGHPADRLLVDRKGR